MQRYRESYKNEIEDLGGRERGKFKLKSNRKTKIKSSTKESDKGKYSIVERVKKHEKER